MCLSILPWSETKYEGANYSWHIFFIWPGHKLFPHFNLHTVDVPARKFRCLARYFITRCYGSGLWGILQSATALCMTRVQSFLKSFSSFPRLLLCPFPPPYPTPPSSLLTLLSAGIMLLSCRFQILLVTLADLLRYLHAIQTIKPILPSD